MLGVQHVPLTQTLPEPQFVLQVAVLPEHALAGPVPVHTPAAQPAGGAQQALPGPAVGLSGVAGYRLQLQMPVPFTGWPQPSSTPVTYLPILAADEHGSPAVQHIIVVAL